MGCDHSIEEKQDLISQQKKGTTITNMGNTNTQIDRVVDSKGWSVAVDDNNKNDNNSITHSANPLLIDTGSKDEILSSSSSSNSPVISPNSPVISPKQISSVKKIQRSVRRKIAMRRCDIEHQWKIFNDLHNCDEAEMLTLAFFMQTLLDKVPGADKWDSSRLVSNLEDDDESQSSIKLQVIKVSEVVEIHGNKDYTNFKIKNSKTLDEHVVTEIIEVYKHPNGALDPHLLNRILRAAYKLLKAGGPGRKVDISNNSKINVIGDLHGNLLDLLHILDEAGLPSEINKFVFNGDFVDRGENSVEVMTLLITLLVVYPDYVVLNRGNHEDMAVNRVYGFQNECTAKYDELTYGMFNEIFRYLPLYTIVNDTVFIVHGGLFHDPNVTLQDLECIDRIDYAPVPSVPYPENTVGLEPADERKEYLKQLQRGDSTFSTFHNNIITIFL